MSLHRAFLPGVTAFVGSTAFPVLEAHTSHDVDEPVGKTTVTIALPRPAAVVFNGVLTVSATIDGKAGTIFQGPIRNDREQLDETGAFATLSASGWASRLAAKAVKDVAWTGPIAAHRVIRGLLEAWGFGGSGAPTFEVHRLVDLAGTDILLGGNPDVDASQVRALGGSSPLSFMERVCRLFGYRPYDRGDAKFLTSRVTSAPDQLKARWTFTEGDTIIGAVRDRSADPVANWIEALGARGRTADGEDFAIRSFPAAVPANALIANPPGAVRKTVGPDDLLSSQALANLARQVHEIEHNSAGPYERIEFETWGQPTLLPGGVMLVTAPSVGVSGAYRVMRVAHDWSEAGLWTTVHGWRPAGNPLPGGDDVCRTETLIDGGSPIHVGDETIPWYANSPPAGHDIVRDFTPLADFTSITITGRAHGVNSYLLGGGSAVSQVSRFALEQPIGTQIGEGVIPSMDERYAQQLDYDDDANWGDFAVPVPGTLKGGIASRLRLKSGYDTRLPASTAWDDWEVKALAVTSCAPGQPVLPSEPTNPGPPALPPPRPPSRCLPLTLVGGVAGQIGGVGCPSHGCYDALVYNVAMPAGARYLTVSGTFSRAVNVSMLGGAGPFSLATGTPVTFDSGGHAWAGLTLQFRFNAQGGQCCAGDATVSRLCFWAHN